MDSCPSDVGLLGEKARCVVPSVRQVHPLIDDKMHQAYDKSGTIEAPPPPPPSLGSMGVPQHNHPPPPNICVEGGRIEFIKLPSDGGYDAVEAKPPMRAVDAPAKALAKITVTRAQQTDDDDSFDQAKVGATTRTDTALSFGSHS